MSIFKPVSVVGDCHHLLPAVGCHPDQLLLDAHVQLGHGPVTAMQCPEKTPFLVVLLPSSRLEPECWVLVHNMTALVCGEVIFRCWGVLPYKGIESPRVD